MESLASQALKVLLLRELDDLDSQALATCQLSFDGQRTIISGSINAVLQILSIASQMRIQTLLSELGLPVALKFCSSNGLSPFQTDKFLGRCELADSPPNPDTVSRYFFPRD